jgi:type IV fimbrial biogenesis protein FimT
MKSSRIRGVSLIEVLVAIAIAAILGGLAAPPFLESLSRNRLDGAVSVLANDLQYTRSEAIRRRTAATLSVAAGGASYTVAYTPAAGGNDVVIKTVPLPDGVTLAAGAPVVFEGLRGTTAAQTLTGESTQTAAKLNITTNAMGRVSTCSPDGSLKGHPAC